MFSCLKVKGEFFGKILFVSNIFHHKILDYGLSTSSFLCHGNGLWALYLLKQHTKHYRDTFITLLRTSDFVRDTARSNTTALSAARHLINIVICKKNT